MKKLKYVAKESSSAGEAIKKIFPFKNIALRILRTVSLFVIANMLLLITFFQHLRIRKKREISTRGNERRRVCFQREINDDQVEGKTRSKAKSLQKMSSQGWRETRISQSKTQKGGQVGPLNKHFDFFPTLYFVFTCRTTFQSNKPPYAT